MSLPEYAIHLNSRAFASLFDEPDEDKASAPFFEDMAEIDRIIEEEIGKPRRGRRKKMH